MIKLVVWLKKEGEDYVGFEENKADRIRKELSGRLLRKNLGVHSVGSGVSSTAPGQYWVVIILKDEEKYKEIKAIIEEVITRYLIAPYIQIKKLSEKELEESEILH